MKIKLLILFFTFFLGVFAYNNVQAGSCTYFQSSSSASTCPGDSGTAATDYYYPSVTLNYGVGSFGTDGDTADGYITMCLGSSCISDMWSLDTLNLPVSRGPITINGSVPDATFSSFAVMFATGPSQQIDWNVSASPSCYQNCSPPPPPPPTTIFCSPTPSTINDNQNQTWTASPSGSYDWDYGSGFVLTSGGDGTDSLGGHWPTPVAWTTVSVSNGSETADCLVYVNNSVSPLPVPPPPPGPTPTPTPGPVPPPPAGAFNGVVFNDMDADGVKDASEPLISGVRVWLYHCLGGSCDPSVSGETDGTQSQVTGSDGYYLYSGLDPSASYRLLCEVPVGSTGNTNDRSPSYTQVPRTHNFGFSFPNAGPSAPIISGPTTGYTDTSYSFSFLDAIDPQGDPVRYAVDWDLNGTVDELLPSSGYIASGGSQSTYHSWSSAGIRDFQARAQDSLGANSAWANHSMTISPAPVPPPQFLVVAVRSPITGGMVTSDVPGINCGADCSESYDINTVVNLIAIPNSSYWKFNGWSGSCSGVGICSLNSAIPAVINVTATFVPRIFNYEEF